MLDPRKLKILYAIINSYVITGEPIGSRTICKQYNLGISPATIRNEMSDLEELGYLNKAHTSSGRIPSDKAYRHYVNTLLHQYLNAGLHQNKPNQQDTQLKKTAELGKLISDATKLLSAITNYTSIALTKNRVTMILKHLDFIPINDREFVIILVFDTGYMKNYLIRLPESIMNDHFSFVVRILNQRILGLDLNSIPQELDQMIVDFQKQESFLKYIREVFIAEQENSQKVQIQFEGLSKIFDYPEYQNMRKAKEFIDFLEDTESVAKELMDKFDPDIEIKIGEENHLHILATSTIITTSYFIGDSIIGKVGIIGPTRMAYEKTIETILNLSYRLKDMINSINDMEIRRY